MKKYTLQDSGVKVTIRAADLDDARVQARDWAAEGDYEADTTIWVDVVILHRGERVDTVTVGIDPPAPRCPGGGHDWQSPHDIVGGIKENPGVWGHGGGVVIHECCVRCGARRMTDTWAQRPDTGAQGLQSVSYDGPGYYSVADDA